MSSLQADESSVVVGVASMHQKHHPAQIRRNFKSFEMVHENDAHSSGPPFDQNGISRQPDSSIIGGAYKNQKEMQKRQVPSFSRFSS